MGWRDQNWNIMNCLKCRVTLLAMEEGAGERETDVI